MPTYYSPGVYVEEYLNPLSTVDTDYDPGDATAAFVGTTSGGGPVGPTRVTSWSQYQSLFGGIANSKDALSYAVYTFFNNGGTGCYVLRALNADATKASLTLTDGAPTTPADVLVVEAIAPGTWASSASSFSRVHVAVRTGNSGPGRFDLIIEAGVSPYQSAREEFVDLSMDPVDPRYVLNVVNSPVVGSNYVRLDLGTGYVYNPETPVIPATLVRTPLSGGTDGTGSPDLVAATKNLDSLGLDLVVNVPGLTASEASELTDWATDSGRHFLVVDVPAPSPEQTAAEAVTAMSTFVDALPSSSHVACYGPWFYVADPGSTAGVPRLVAPGGAVVGHYMRTDATRGVFKAPAGIQTSVVGGIQPAFSFSNVQEDTINQSGINLLKVVPGAGLVIWGARTQSNGYPDRYIPVRRLLISLKSSLTAITRFAVFENNGPDLWDTVENVVSKYLQTLFDLGAFQGSSTDQAFFVTCDDRNNSTSTISAGVVNIEVGVALRSPAEFIIIRLGQKQTGTIVTDTLSADEGEA